MKKRLSILILIIVLVILPGCKGYKPSAEIAIVSNEDSVSYITEVWSAGKDAELFTLYGEKVYFNRNKKLFSSALDGSNTKRLRHYSPTDGYYLIGLSAGKFGLWVIEARTDTGDCMARLLEDDGTTILETEPFEAIPYGVPQTDSEGKLYFPSVHSDFNTLLQIDTGGTIKTIKTDGRIISVATGSDGSIYALLSDVSGTSLYSLEASGKWKKEAKLPLPDNIWLENGDNLYNLYAMDGGSLYGIDLINKKVVLILNWLDCGLSGGGNLYSIGNDEFLYQTIGGITHLMPGEEDARQVLILAALAPRGFLRSEVEKFILSFNEQNDKYRVKTEIYDSIDKLALDIITGADIDIFEIDANGHIPLGLFSNKGVLEDLYPYIDADPELDREDFLDAVLRAYDDDGSLYVLPTYVSIRAFVGLRNIVDDGYYWTWDEFFDSYSKMPEGAEIIAGVNREFMLDLLSLYTFNDFVDWETGVCSFDSPEFIDLLNFLASFPEEMLMDPKKNLTDFMNGNAFLLNYAQFPYFVISPEQFVGFDVAFGFGNYVLKGFPSDSSGRLGFVTGPSFGIASNSKQKNGAWEFVRSTLLPCKNPPPSRFGFPTNKETLNMNISRLTQPLKDEDGGLFLRSINIYNNDYEYEYITQAQVEVFYALIDACNCVLYEDSFLTSIIEEECAAFFAGDKSAEETARLIQNRASIYVEEQR